MTAKHTTRTGVTIGRSYQSTLHPEEAAPLEIPRPPRFDWQDRVVMAISVAALIALVVILTLAGKA